MIYKLDSLKDVFCCTWPKRDSIENFKKGMSEERIWTIEEMREIANVTQPTDEWESVYEIMGGIPRIVFESRFSEDRAIGALEHAASKCDLHKISSLVGVYEIVSELEEGDVVHKVVHIHTKAPYHHAYLEFASHVAIYYVCKAHMTQINDFWGDLASVNRGGHLLGQLIGGCFEIRALQIVEQGGDFECFKLIPDGKRRIPQNKLKITPCEHALAKEPAYTQPMDVVHVPLSRSFVGMDAWIRGVGGLQVTRNARHDLKMAVKPHLEKLGVGGANKLYWVLRGDQFDSFTWKTPQSKTGEEYREIEQYVIKIPDEMISAEKKLLDDWLEIHKKRTSQARDMDCD
jgi:hypothetical protein